MTYYQTEEIKRVYEEYEELKELISFFGGRLTGFGNGISFVIKRNDKEYEQIDLSPFCWSWVKEKLEELKYIKEYPNEDILL
ncbi:MAG: hypothetical protein AABY07_01245 [Nanoarchaeota archaeon]